MITTRTLEQMQNRPTSHQVVVIAGGVTTHLDFSVRKTKSVLLSMAQRHSETVLALLGDWDADAIYNAQHGWTFGPARVCFSGRTERDVCVAGGV